MQGWISCKAAVRVIKTNLHSEVQGMAESAGWGKVPGRGDFGRVVPSYCDSPVCCTAWPQSQQTSHSKSHTAEPRTLSKESDQMGQAGSDFDIYRRPPEARRTT